MSFIDKVVIITGGAQGLGKEFCKGLLESGAKTQEKFGTLDIFISNAGIICEGPDWKRCVSINLVAVIEGCKLTDKYMSKRSGGKGGAVLNIASIAGLDKPEGAIPVYGATKSGVIGLTRCLAKQAEELNSGIKYVSVCPGPISTDLLYKLKTADGMMSYGVHGIDPMKFTSNQIERTENVVRICMEFLLTDNNNRGILKIVATEKCEYIYGEPNVSKI